MRRIFTVAAAAVAISALAIPAASASTHHARPNATPACGINCFDLSSLELGHTQVLNAYVPGDTGIGGKAGQKVNLHYGSDSHPNEDFTGAQVGTLLDFCPNFGGTGLSATSYACINYPKTYPVFEADWSPFGNQSDLCVGAAEPITAGENTTLQQCGDEASTLWVGDLHHAFPVPPTGVIPWVNGASTTFSHPLVLTVDPGSRNPANQVKLQTENLLTGGALENAQEWRITFGPIF